MSENSTNNAQTQNDLRQLALVDKIIGLEAEIARITINQEQISLEKYRSSLEWRIGYGLLLPLRKIKRIFSKSEY